MKYATEVLQVLQKNLAVHTATKFISPREVIRATRRSARSFVVTNSRPNYRARHSIKLFRKAGEPFPVRKIQLQFYRSAK